MTNKAVLLDQDKVHILVAVCEIYFTENVDPKSLIKSFIKGDEYYYHDFQVYLCLIDDFVNGCNRGGMSFNSENEFIQYYEFKLDYEPTITLV